jgi:hypothetical protein
MDVLATLGLLLGASWASGISLYASVFVLGISQRLGWITLPGSLDSLGALPIVVTAGALYVLEFIADKVPGFDAFWDTIHAFIRPLGGAALAFLAVSGTDASPTFQVLAALLGGAIALGSHVTKATSRLAINTSPEPISNWVASLAGDGLVLALIWLAVSHPLVALVVVLSLAALSIWFLQRVFRLVQSLFRLRRQRGL